MTRLGLWSVITACTCQLPSLLHGFSPLLNNRKYINYRYKHCHYKHVGSSNWNRSQGSDLYEQMRCCGSRRALHHGEVGKHCGTTWRSCTRTTPLSLLTDCTLPLEGTVAFITEWFPYTGFLAATRYLLRLNARPLHGLTRLLRLPCLSTDSDDPISPAVGHNMPYAQLPIVHCPMPIAHNYPPKLALSQEKWG